MGANGPHRYLMHWHGTNHDLELSIRCGGTTHTVRWDDGAFEMLDHPDADSERALVAFGGPEPACLGVFELWNDGIVDGGFLEDWVVENHLSLSYLSWLGMAIERMRLEGFQEFLRDLPIHRAERMGRFVHTFPLPGLNRAAAEVSSALASGSNVACANAPRLLTEAAAQRLRRSFVSAVGDNHMPLGAAALVRLDIDVTERRETTVHGNLLGQDARVGIRIARDWLHEVWALGASTIGGDLVVDLTLEEDVDDRGQVTAVAYVVKWPSRQPALAAVRVRHTGAGWVRLS